jgi:hypothetical protein
MYMRRRRRVRCLASSIRASTRGLELLPLDGIAAARAGVVGRSRSRRPILSQLRYCY